ncbi:probable C-mannosyltransferase DPY19L3 [Lytechinus variegatus]|uniref:probable C-mannosyltransferase DPY19L3 n=1 Tax=Lytechinus variegatus TaxID=7654 RepID=UPI001BB1E3DF|nr:probable C-mannosyltransferase DPY19L3 [Lytechinus variegatus]
MLFYQLINVEDQIWILRATFATSNTKMESAVKASVPTANGRNHINCSESDVLANGHTNGKLQKPNSSAHSNRVSQTNCAGQSTIAKNGHSAKANGHPMGQRNGRTMRNGRTCNGRTRRMKRPWGWDDWLILVCGICVGLGVGVAYAWFIYMLHENTLWFTHIEEVEREISFRTESGLYYSYYKQFINAPTISQGFYELTNDNTTENWRTINVIQRFNIYQEIFLAFVYRILPFIQSNYLPIFFYIKSVFALHGVYFTTIFAMAWLLSNSWLSGLLACTFFIANKANATRIDYTIPLRESFALPFLYMQMTIITYYLRPTVIHRQRVCLALIAATTFLFVLTWQFAQFILLLQAMALYLGTITGVIPIKKVKYIFSICVGSILAVFILQFFNKMLLGSLALSFVIVALLDFRLQAGRPVVTSISGQLVKLLERLVFTFAGMFILNFTIKILIGLDADQHIFKFITAKFGLASARDFDVLLYKCHSAFAFLPIQVIRNMTSTLLFPLYMAVVFGLLSVLVLAVIQNWNLESRISAGKKDDDIHQPATSSSPSPDPPSDSTILCRPDLAYHTLQTIPFGLMALLVVRMKFVWTPQMCVLAAFGIGNASLWRWLLGKVGCKSETTIQCVRHGVAVAIIAVAFYLCYPEMSAELNNLREFYDPDTVELMNWISQQTPKTAVFSGSMQLLAGVKLCTGRRLTNHPHYEDKQLRDKTLELYQYYARRSAKDVYNIHRATGTDYIILEDSICYARSSEVGCRLPDILDIMNGHLYSEANPALEPDLKVVQTRRFCDAVQSGAQDVVRFFKMVFQNRTFRVYQLVPQSQGG